MQSLREVFPLLDDHTLRCVLEASATTDAAFEKLLKMHNPDLNSPPFAAAAAEMLLSPDEAGTFRRLAHLLDQRDRHDLDVRTEWADQRQQPVRSMTSRRIQAPVVPCESANPEDIIASFWPEPPAPFEPKPPQAEPPQTKTVLNELRTLLDEILNENEAAAGRSLYRTTSNGGPSVELEADVTHPGPKPRASGHCTDDASRPAEADRPVHIVFTSPTTAPSHASSQPSQHIVAARPTPEQRRKRSLRLARPPPGSAEYRRYSEEPRQRAMPLSVVPALSAAPCPSERAVDAANAPAGHAEAAAPESAGVVPSRGGRESHAQAAAPAQALQAMESAGVVPSRGGREHAQAVAAVSEDPEQSLQDAISRLVSARSTSMPSSTPRVIAAQDTNHNSQAPPIERSRIARLLLPAGSAE